MISLGDAFWAQNPNSNNPPHLYFVITDPGRNDGHVLLVNMTERRSGSDGSCILQCGDHPSATKESVIRYAEAIFPEARTVEQAVNQGIFIQAAPADLKLVQRLLEGALASRHLRMKYRPIVEAELRQLGSAL
jgi:hypothetical protein